MKRKRSLRTIIKRNYGQFFLNFVFILITLCYVVPLLLMVSASFTAEEYLTSPEYGFSIIPGKLSIEAYRQVFRDHTQLINGYKVTIFFSIVSTVLHILVIGTMAYPLSRESFILRRPINFLLLFSMLFSPGMVPTYLLVSGTLHLSDNILVYIIPGLVSAWNIIIVRTSYRNVPFELIESARLEGASEMRICFSIVIPLCKATLASVGFLFLVGKWNDWMTTSIYIRDMDLYSLQYLLQRILREAEFIRSLIDQGILLESAQKIPEESYRYAMAVVAAGPMLFVFPFFQKYFAKGMTLGSVKG